MVDGSVEEGQGVCGGEEAPERQRKTEDNERR